MMRVEPNEKGELDYKYVESIVKDHVDPYVAECKMN